MDETKHQLEIEDGGIEHGGIEDGGIAAGQLSASRSAFAVGALLFLVGSVLLFDQIGPTTHRPGTVGDVRVEQVVRRHSITKRYVIAGRDGSGAAFEVGVDPATFRRASKEDPVTVERSLLSGRAVAVTGPGWSSARSVLVVLPIIVVAPGLVLLGFVLQFCIGDLRRRGSLDQRRAQRRVLAILTGVIVVGVVIWVGISRDAANLSAPAADATPPVATR